MSINFDNYQEKFAELFSAVFREVNYRISAVMGIRHEDTSGSTTDDRNVAAQHADHVEKVIRGFLDEVDMGHLTRSSSRDKNEFQRVFDEIIENIKSFVVDDIKEKREAAEDIFERSKHSFAGLLVNTAGEATASCFAVVARIIPATIIRLHNTWLT